MEHHAGGADGRLPYTVIASVTDPAGNPGTDSQPSIVDTAHRRSPSPAVERTDQGRHALHLRDRGRGARQHRHGDPRRRDPDRLRPAGGTWAVTSPSLSDGPHRVILHVIDAAGNPATFTHTLTVDTVAPAVTDHRRRHGRRRPMSAPPSPAPRAPPPAPPSPSRSPARRSRPSCRPDRTCNATPTPVGNGTWTVVASAPDPAGNVGSAMQTLAIDPGAPGPAQGRDRR